MNHKENYGKLYNTLSVIETKGENTVIMANCLNFLKQCFRECEAEEKLEGSEDVQG